MKMKKLTAALLAGVMLVCSVSATAYADSIGIAEGELDESTGLLYVPIDEGAHYKVTYPDGAHEIKAKDIVIPEQYKGKDVTQMDGCFLDEFGLTSISIPKTVVEITDSKRDGRPCLENITVDNQNPAFCSVNGVLFNKDQTKLIRYPSAKEGASYEIPYTVETVGKSAFAQSDKLTTIKVPFGVKEFGAFAFSDCDSLKSIELPISLLSIGTEAFRYCGNMKELNIPENVTSIGSSIAEGSGIEIINVSSDNKNYCSVDNVIFTKDKKTLIAYPCGSTAESYEIPQGTTTLLPQSLAYSCLAEVIIPDTVIDLGKYTFMGCSNLKSVVISEGVTELDATFFICYSLETITLPKSITKIMGQTFGDYIEGESKSFIINYNGTKEDWGKIEIDSTANTKLNQATIKCTDGDIKLTISDVVQEGNVKVNDDGSKDFSPEVKKDVTVDNDDIENMKKVTVSAPKDAFADNVTMKVTHDSFKPSGGSSFAVDISFVDASGNKVQPKEAVTVKLPIPDSLKGKDPLFVYHVGDDGTTEKISAEKETIDGTDYMVFAASKFSVYAIVYTEAQEDNTPDQSDSSNTFDPFGPSQIPNIVPVANTTGETTEPESTATEAAPAQTTEAEASEGSDNKDSNQPTGAAIALVPAILAAAGVVLTHKKK